MPSYNNLDEIRQRKDQLGEAIAEDSQLIGGLWEQLFVRKENPSRGEQIVSLVTHAVTAVDTFLLVRKLMKNYAGVLSFFSSGKKRRNRKK